jgi:hypothetical protein
MKPQAYLLLIALLALALCKITYPQYKNVPFALSPYIGDTLNLNERDYYGLYKDFNGFQRAVYFISKDGLSALTRISYLREGEIIDSLIEQNATYAGNLRAFVRIVDVRRMDNWKDAREITLTDVSGNKYSGSFFDLEKNRLYIATSGLTDYSQVIKNYKIINKEDIKSIYIAGKRRNMMSKAGLGVLIGGGIGALLGYAGGDDNHGWFSTTAGQKAIAGGIIFGVIGGVIGLISSLSVPPSDNEIIAINTDEDFYGLSKFLKNKDFNTQISKE